MSDTLSRDFDRLEVGGRFRTPGRTITETDLVSFATVRIGDTIHVEGELESKKELDDATGLVVFNWRIVNQRSEAVALAKVRVVWRRSPRPAPAAAAAEPVYL
jgi:acyl dehydratase